MKNNLQHRTYHFALHACHTRSVKMKYSFVGLIFSLASRKLDEKRIFNDQNGTLCACSSSLA